MTVVFLEQFEILISKLSNFGRELFVEGPKVR